MRTAVAIAFLPGEIPVTYRSVEAAICACIEGDDIHAFDIEAAAAGTTREPPNPGKTITVRRTGSEGGYRIPDAIGAIERAHVVRLVMTLPEVQRALAVGYACRIPTRHVLRYLREERRQPVSNERVNDLRDEGLSRLKRLLVAAGLVEG